MKGSWVSFISIHLQLAVASYLPFTALAPRTPPLYPFGITDIEHPVTGPPFLFLTASASWPAWAPLRPFRSRLSTVFFRSSPSSFFLFTPTHLSCPRASSLQQLESLPSASLLCLSRSLDPSAFYYQPHYLRGNPAPSTCSAMLPRLPQAGRSCYTIFYCVFTTEHNYY